MSTVDIREDVGVEMVFDVLQSGYKLLPHYWFYNEEGVMVFASLDHDPDWYQRPYPAGRYTATAWIPGNLLSPGMLFVNAALITRSPDSTQFNESQIIAFGVGDNMGKGTARGDWAGQMPGVVRPLLEWTTQVELDAEDRMRGQL